MSEAYIVAAARTPIGKFGGALKDLSPADQGAIAMQGALEKATREMIRRIAKGDNKTRSSALAKTA